MRLDKRHSIGDAGAVYEFNVKLSMKVRGVQVEDMTLGEDTERAIEELADELRSKFRWVGRVYRTGRSGGWLAIEDKTGGATESALEVIGEMVDAARERFEQDLVDVYGYEQNGIAPKAYDFFKKHAGGRVGHNAEGALNLARAEAYADDHGWEAVWDEDPEEYQSGGDHDPRPFEVYNCVIRDENGVALASVGGIGMTGHAREDGDRRRLTEAELALGAMPKGLNPNGGVVRTSPDAGRAGAHSYRGASIWVSGPSGGTWYATVKPDGCTSQDLDAKSYDDLLQDARDWVDGHPQQFQRNRSPRLSYVDELRQKSLPRLRHMQSVVEQQITKASRQGNTRALEELQVRERELQAAVMEKEFGGDLQQNARRPGAGTRRYRMGPHGEEPVWASKRKLEEMGREEGRAAKLRGRPPIRMGNLTFDEAALAEYKGDIKRNGAPEPRRFVTGSGPYWTYYETGSFASGDKTIHIHRTATRKFARINALNLQRTHGGFVTVIHKGREVDTVGPDRASWLSERP